MFSFFLDIEKFFIDLYIARLLRDDRVDFNGTTGLTE